MSQVELSELKIQDHIKAGRRVHFIGIGGIGMSGLAKALKHLGLEVSGSDLKAGREVRELEKLGVRVFLGHDMARVRDQDFVVYSSAVTMNNPERREAILRSIPLFHRAEILSVIMNQAISIAVTGTHGKTTTSALISFLMMKAGLNPTCFIGGMALNFGSNAFLGDEHLVVAEVDESDKSHLLYRPDYTVLTNLEEDHLDTYQNIDNLKAAFREFVSNIKSTGRVVYSGHDENLKEIITGIPNAIAYGLSKKFVFGAENITNEGFKTKFTLYEKGKQAADVALTIPGTHNVLNSLGAIAILRAFGLPLDVLAKSISEFRGVGRRLEIKLDIPQLMVIDDYAHHPTEVEASLRAIRSLGKKTTVIFQPHRYSRTKYLGASFSKAFHLADRLILTDIYGAGEDNSEEVSVKDLYQLVKESNHPDVQMVAKDQIINHLIQDTDLSGAVVFLGAGDITEVANEFARRFDFAHPK